MDPAEHSTTPEDSGIKAEEDNKGGKALPSIFTSFNDDRPAFGDDLGGMKRGFEERLGGYDDDLGPRRASLPALGTPRYSGSSGSGTR